MAGETPGHIVVVIDQVLSKRLSAVEMARRLRRAGFRITLLGAGGDYDSVDGLDYIRVDLTLGQPPPCVSGDRPGIGPAGRWLRAFADRRRRREAIIRDVDLRAYRELLEELSPDLLLVDIEAHSFIIPALAMPVPVALFSVFFNLFRGPGAPPLHTDVLPGRGWRGSRPAITWLWLRFRFWKWVGHRREAIRHCGADKLSLLRHYARSCGVDPRDWLDCYQWLIPFVYRRLPVLVLNLEEMDFSSSPPAPVHYVGPMICTDRDRLPFLPEREPVPADLRALLDGHRAGTNTRRLVYCGFGSFFGGDDSGFLKTVIAAASGRDWDLVIALGNRLDTEALGPLPANVHCLNFAPQVKLLEAADAAIVHGGMTTIYECLFNGVPVVVYPFAVNDQGGTAARVVHHGLGVAGDRRRDRVDDIRSRVERVLGDDSMRRSVDRMRRHVDRYEEENVAAGVVGGLMGITRPEQ